MKKVLILALLLIFTTVNVFAFTFPEPDWGKLLQEKTEMVTETDFELYVEGSLESAPYFGAKFEPRSGAYLGMIAETSELVQPIGAYLTYVEDMWQDDLYYPANEMIRSDNVIAMVGWTINDINSVDYNQVRKVLNNLNSYNKPMFIRFANEMNVSTLGDEPEKYKEVFRTVADMVHEYPNFAVVWSPNDIGGLDRPFEYFYPGDEYVDWIGVSAYMKKYFQGKQNTAYKDTVYFMTGDYAWATNSVKPIVEFMEENNIKKPLMLSECGVATNNSFGDNMENWATPRLENMLNSLIMKYPQIKMINYFNTHREYEVEKYDISDYSYAIDIFNKAKNSGAYITSYGGAPEFVYNKAKDCEILTAKDGKINLYTLAHFPEYPDVTVNYLLDGNWYGMSSEIPYSCALYISGISDGAHTIEISAYDKSEKYTFYKAGGNISFSKELKTPFETEKTDEITIEVNGEEIFCDVLPFIKHDRTLVPVRAIFEALNADVFWDDAEKTVTAKKDGLEVVLRIDSNEMKVGNEVKIIDVPAMIENSRTFVPARAVSEAFGCDVKWDDSTRTVKITQ